MIIDTSSDTTSKVRCLASLGVQTVIRYYSFKTRRRGKHLGLAEAEELAANGLQIAMILQEKRTARLISMRGEDPRPRAKRIATLTKSSVTHQLRDLLRCRL